MISSECLNAVKTEGGCSNYSIYYIDYIDCQKAKFNENCVKTGQSRLYIQAVPLAGSIF